MARAHFVKKARRAYRAEGIKKGESYWWWKFKRGTKQRSKTQPRPSQLTQSEFWGAVYDLQERLDGLTESDGAESVRSEIECIIDEIRSLGSDQLDKQGNMPESLQQSETGELLENRATGCDDWADNVESAIGDIDGDCENEAEALCNAVCAVEYEGE